jgi:hypothetical protein
VLQENSVVGSVTNLLGVEQDLLELPLLRKARDDLVRDVGSEIDGKSEIVVNRLDEVTELFTAVELERHWAD